MTDRIAPLDEGAFCVPEGAKSMRDDGSPWTHWARVEDAGAGWYALGDREPAWDALGPDSDFWDIVLALGTAAGNQRLDACHCVGDCILSIGGLGISLASGYGEPLLAECATQEPLLFLRHMMPAMQASGAYPTSLDLRLADTIDPLDVFLEHVDEGPLTQPHQINGVIRAGSAGERYTEKQKRLARIWVQGISAMLWRPAMDVAQRNFCRRCLPRMLTPTARARIEWPTNGADDMFQWTKAQQALWAVCMVIAPCEWLGVEQFLMQTVTNDPQDARASMRRMLELTDLTHEQDAVQWSARLAARCRRAVGRACSIFGVDVEGL
jgi:hypothetical protein